MPRGKRGPKPDDLKESPENQAPMDEQFPAATDYSKLQTYTCL